MSDISESKGLATIPEIEVTSENFVKAFMLKRYGGFKSRVDIYALAEYMDLPVCFGTFAGNQRGGNRWTGYLSEGKAPVRMWENGEEVWRLYPKGTIVLEQQLRNSGREEDIRKLRFTTAHECAHWVMGYFREVDEDRQCAPGLISLEEQQSGQLSREQQVDRCGACLLMPRFLMMRALHEVNGGKRIPIYGKCVLSSEGDRTVQRLANAMRVNYMPMRYRLEELGLYEPHPIEELIDALLDRMRRDRRS